MPTSKQDKILKRAIKRSDIYSVITQLAAFGQLNKKYKTKSKKLIRKTAKFGIMAISNLATKGAALASKGAALAQAAPLAQAAKGAALAQVAPFTQAAKGAKGALAGVPKAAPALARVVKSVTEATKGATALAGAPAAAKLLKATPSEKKDEEQEVSTTTTTPVTPAAPGAKPVGFGKKKAVRKSKGKGKSGRRGVRV